MVAAKRDLWVELALQQPNGASYEFFETLLPPPRYVHADFRYYPLVLSAPGANTKARLISNGSGVNLRGGSRSWKDVGTRSQFLRLLQRMFDGSHVGHPCVEYQQVRSFRIETEVPGRVNLDGELKGHAPVAVEVLPSAMRVFA